LRKSNNWCLRNEKEIHLHPQFRRGLLDALSPKEVFDVMQLRQQVFVLEQQCLYPDMDAYDLSSVHILMYTADELMGTARILPPGTKYLQASIGRVSVRESHRGNDYGRLLMVNAMKASQELFPGVNIRISAQQRLEPFYQALGFLTVSAPYDEDGIIHIDMVLEVN